MFMQFTEYLVSELAATRVLMYRESHPEDTEQSCESKGKEQRKWESLNMGNKDEQQEISPAQEDKINLKEVNKDLAELFQTLGLETSSQMSDTCAEVRNITSQCLVIITGDFTFLVISNMCVMYSGGDTADITSRR